MKTAQVTERKLRSPLMEAMRLKPSSGRKSRRKMVATLVLTSLVDAFSIMLLYLLVQNTGNGSTIEMQNVARLPVAQEATALHDGTLVRIEGDKYFLGNEPVEEPVLAARLQEERAKQGEVDESNLPSLIVQADRDTDFSRLARVIRAGSVSGFHKFKFAVMQEEGSL